MSETPNRLNELDALRGIAALMVVFFHFTLDRPESTTFFTLGSTGVELFFIISGFVIFMSVSKISSSKEFLINRFSRLYPTYWASVIFSTSAILLYALYVNNRLLIIGPKQFFANMTMFQHYLDFDNIEGPYWTMIVEMLFYIYIVVLYHFKRLHNIEVVSTSLILIVLFSAFWLDGIIDSMWLISSIPLLKFLPLFFAGILFYKVYNKQHSTKDWIGLVFCYLSQIALSQFSGKASSHITPIAYNLMITLFFIVFGLFTAGRLRLIVSKVTMFFGKISFPLYLTHQFISTKFIIPTLVFHYGLNFWVAAIFVALPAVIIIAFCINYFIEVPLSRKLRNGLRKFA